MTLIKSVFESDFIRISWLDIIVNTVKVFVRKYQEKT